MTIDVAAELGREALYLAVLITLPTMLTGMLVGLLISIFQSVTSIQEQTLSIVPKIIVTLLITIIALPWLTTRVVEYTYELYLTIPARF